MNEFKVGLLAIATLVSLAYMSLKITSNQSGFGDYITYKSVIKDASGIFPKTPIKVAGINAGRIVKIELKGNTALVTYEVLKRVEIRKGSKLRVKTVGFLGDKYLEIYVGDGDLVIEEGSLIDAFEGAGLETLTKDAAEILREVKDIVKSVKNSVAPEGEKSPVEIILKQVQEVLKNSRLVTENINEVLSTNKGKIESLISKLEKAASSIEYQLNTNNRQSIANDLSKVMKNADALTSNLNELVSDIKSGKGTMGKILVEEEIADEVKETIAGVKKIVDKVDAIRTELSVFSNVNTRYAGETTAELKIFPAPERFYTLGITTSEFGVEEEKEITTILNGVESREVNKTIEKDTYRFNLQVGRKVHNWVFRGGLIESSGGIGIDYSSKLLGTVLTAEFFDYREDLGINLRLSSEIHVWNVLYGKASADDLLTSYRNYSFGIGLRFLDEDLKGLLGFFL
jgi:phospholipid/cholesterol/gamma-HCH transport system substrate-binding protein